MANAPETISTLNGLFKEQYGEDGLPDLVPSSAVLQQRIKFVSKDLELGDQYAQPVRLAYPNGFTHAVSGAGAFTLKDSKNGTLKKAIVQGSQILLRDQVDYESAAKASKGGKKAFLDITQVIFQGLQKSMRKRVEIELLHGGVNIGVVSSYSAPTITLTAASYAPGIWAGMEGANIDVYNGGSLRGTDSIASVDIDAKTITLTTGVAGTTAGDLMYFEGAATNEMSGVHAILSNAGSLFNISAASFSLWKSSQYDAGTAALTFAKVRKAVSAAVGKGLDEDCVVMVNPKTWDNLMDDLASLRRYDKSDKAYSLGAETVEFYSQNGKIEIVPSIFVKEGFAYGLCMPEWQRIGAADVTFNTPGYGDQIFFQIIDKAGVELRCYTHQAIFSNAPAKSFLIKNIVNS